MGNFIEKCTFIQVFGKLDVCRDKKDNMVLELAIEGNAILIVSGDDDLLSLNPFKGIQIITARAFLELARYFVFLKKLTSVGFFALVEQNLKIAKLKVDFKDTSAVIKFLGTLNDES